MEIAKTVVLDTNTGVVTINGAPLGFYLADEPIDVTLTHDGLQVIRLPLYCDSLEIIPTGRLAAI